MRLMRKDPDLRRYDDPKVVESLAVFELLRRTNNSAPQVRKDLLARVAGVTDDAEVEKAVADWARAWHLLKNDGPADWAMAIGFATAKHAPDFGWNLGMFAALQLGDQLPDGYVDDSGVEIFLPPLSFNWNPNRETTADFRRRIFAAMLGEVAPQIDAVTKQYLDLLAPGPHQNADRAFTFLLRYQILEESYTEIARDPNKFREQPEGRDNYSLPDVKRDVDAAARQAGLQPRPSLRGRPPNLKKQHTRRRSNPRRR